MHTLPSGLLSGTMCVKMITVMWIIHAGDLKRHVISILQIRHYITTGYSLNKRPGSEAVCAPAAAATFCLFKMSSCEM